LSTNCDSFGGAGGLPGAAARAAVGSGGWRSSARCVPWLEWRTETRGTVLGLAAADDQEPVEALAADAADPALDVRVRVRRPHRRVDDLDRFAAEDVVEAAAELAVAIVDQEADRLLAVAERHQQVAGLLGYPGTVGRAG